MMRQLATTLCLLILTPTITPYAAAQATEAIATIAGTGKPGDNGGEGPATETNIESISLSASKSLRTAHSISAKSGNIGSGGSTWPAAT